MKMNQRDMEMIGGVFATLSNYLLSVLAKSDDKTISELALNELLARSVKAKA
jgi:hypothetical protein